MQNTWKIQNWPILAHTRLSNKTIVRPLKRRKRLSYFFLSFQYIKFFVFARKEDPKKSIFMRLLRPVAIINRLKGSRNKLSLPEVLPKFEYDYWNSFLNLSTDCPALLLVGSRTSAYPKSAKIPLTKWFKKWNQNKKTWWSETKVKKTRCALETIPG